MEKLVLKSLFLLFHTMSQIAIRDASTIGRGFGTICPLSKKQTMKGFSRQCLSEKCVVCPANILVPKKKSDHFCVISGHATELVSAKPSSGMTMSIILTTCFCVTQLKYEIYFYLLNSFVINYEV